MNRSTRICVAMIALLFVVGLTAAAPALDTTKGRLQAVFPDKQEFVVETPQGKTKTFRLDSTGKVFINNNEAMMADLQPGEEVTIVYEMRMELPVASEIRCIRFQDRQRK